MSFAGISILSLSFLPTSILLLHCFCTYIARHCRSSTPLCRDDDDVMMMMMMMMIRWWWPVEYASTLKSGDGGDGGKMTLASMSSWPLWLRLNNNIFFKVIYLSSLFYLFSLFSPLLLSLYFSLFFIYFLRSFIYAAAVYFTFSTFSLFCYLLYLCRPASFVHPGTAGGRR